MTYCYETRGGVVIDRIFPMGEAPKTIKVGRKLARRSFSAEHASVPSLTGWPFECVASGVGAAEAQNLRDHFDRAGVPTQVSSDGDVIYRNPAHRRKALKCRGMLDRASFI